MVWQDNRSGSFYGIYGTRVGQDGVVFDSGPVVRQEGDQWNLALGYGEGNGMFLVYQGWTGTVGGKTYNTNRIWGKMDPAPGVKEGCQLTAKGSRLMATIVRNVLMIGSREEEADYACLMWQVGR